MRPKDLEFGLLGERLGHSFSPAIHRQLAGYDYQLVELPPEEVEPFLRTGRFRGLNVTIPYKKTVMACCDALSPAAERIGSVNTLLRRPDGTLYGDNTDYDGFRYLLQAAGAQVRGKKALVLGSGGASLTVHAVLADLGARETVGISRNGPNNYENLDRHADAQLIVNATPVGMYPNARVSPVDLEQFPNCEGVFDLIYNPGPHPASAGCGAPGPVVFQWAGDAGGSGQGRGGALPGPGDPGQPGGGDHPADGAADTESAAHRDAGLRQDHGGPAPGGALGAGPWPT